MDRLQKLKALISPSFFSLTLVLFGSAFFLGVTAFITSSGNGMLYELFFGENSSATQIQTARNTVTSLSNTILGNTTLNQLLFFVLWMLIGLAVYVIVAGINREAATVIDFRNQLHYANTRQKVVRREFATRLILRWITLAGWGVYWIIFVKVYAPFSVLCVHIGAADLYSLNGWFFIGSGFVVLCLSLHIHLIFMRLLMQRTRLFDSSY